MDEFVAQLLKADMITGYRHDSTVARQGVMNHQIASHLMDMSFIRDSVEMSIPESYAVQGLSLSHTPREGQATNAAFDTPRPRA